MTTGHHPPHENSRQERRSPARFPARLRCGPDSTGNLNGRRPPGHLQIWGLRVVPCAKRSSCVPSSPRGPDPPPRTRPSPTPGGTASRSSRSGWVGTRGGGPPPSATPTGRRSNGPSGERHRSFPGARRVAVRRPPPHALRLGRHNLIREYPVRPVEHERPQACHRIAAGPSGIRFGYGQVKLGADPRSSCDAARAPYTPERGGHAFAPKMCDVGQESRRCRSLAQAEPEKHFKTGSGNPVGSAEGRWSAARRHRAPARGTDRGWVAGG